MFSPNYEKSYDHYIGEKLYLKKYKLDNIYFQNKKVKYNDDDIEIPLENYLKYEYKIKLITILALIDRFESENTLSKKFDDICKFVIDKIKDTFDNFDEFDNNDVKQCINLIIEKLNSPCKRKYTILFDRVSENDKINVDLLLQLNLNPMITNLMDLNIAHVASEKHYFKMLEIFVKVIDKSRINILFNAYNNIGYNSLYCAIVGLSSKLEECNNDKEEILDDFEKTIKILIENGIDTSVLDKNLLDEIEFNFNIKIQEIIKKYEIR